MATLTKPQEAQSKVIKGFNADQQLKYLHLQAEVEVLLQQLQSRKVRRQLESLVTQ